MHFFGGEQRESLRQIKTHLIAEHRQRTRASTVFFFVAVC